VAVWCVAVATCMGQQEQCRLRTGTMADQSPGDCNLDELPTAELEQICARTGFDMAMASIRRRQRDDPTPNRMDLAIEAEKCLMLDEIRSSDPKKWAHDIVSLFYEQYALFGLENAVTWRPVLVGIFQIWTYSQIAGNPPELAQRLADLYRDAHEKFILFDVGMSNAGSTNDDASALLSNTRTIDTAQEVYANAEFFRIVHLIKLNDTDEKNLLWMMSYLDPNALERLISGDIPDLKSMQPRITIDWIVVSIIGVIALVSAFLLKRSGIFARNGKERDEEGQRAKGGGKKKGRRKRMPADKAVQN